MKTYKDVLAEQAQKENEHEETLGNIPKVEKTNTDRKPEPTSGTVEKPGKSLEAANLQIDAQQKIIENYAQFSGAQKKKHKKVRKALKNAKAQLSEDKRTAEQNLVNERFTNYRFRYVDLSGHDIDAEKSDATKYAASCINKHIDKLNEYTSSDNDGKELPNIPSTNEIIETAHQKSFNGDFLMKWRPKNKLDYFKANLIDKKVVKAMVKDLKNQVDEFTTLAEKAYE